MKFDVKSIAGLSPFEFKNILNHAAAKAHKKHLAKGGKDRYLNSGRGNPNFLNTTVRNAFSYLELFVSHLSATYLSDHPNLGLKPKKNKIAAKLEDFLRLKGNLEEITFLKNAIKFATEKFGFDPDEFVHELSDAAIGDYYPNPPRILTKTEVVVKAYLDQILNLPNSTKKIQFDLFATEGASAAMIYLFNSLRNNKILEAGDEIAVWTPIFAPYLELPLLDSYDLKITYLESRADLDWQLSESEIEKLKNPKIKALFVVNPTNPTSVAIDKKTIKMVADIVKHHNKDLIVITDTVYCTFVDDFYSFLNDIPENTVFIYSFSKYFGVTGWRLGVMMLPEDNILDRLVQKLKKSEKKELEERYKIVTSDVETFKFIDRLEADSREEALAHTGGLSCPQQAMMCLFCLFHLMDEELNYKKMIRDLLVNRAQLFYSHIEIPFKLHSDNTYYYAVIDIAELAREKYGEKFAKYFCKNVHIAEFLLKLACEKFTICLPGFGFHGPEFSIRVSLANLDDDDYPLVGKNIKETLLDYFNEWEKTK